MDSAPQKYPDCRVNNLIEQHKLSFRLFWIHEFWLRNDRNFNFSIRILGGFPKIWSFTEFYLQPIKLLIFSPSVLDNVSFKTLCNSNFNKNIRIGKNIGFIWNVKLCFALGTLHIFKILFKKSWKYSHSFQHFKYTLQSANYVLKALHAKTKREEKLIRSSKMVAIFVGKRHLYEKIS